MDQTKSTVVYPLKGFIIGNGITDWTYDAEPAFYDTAFELNLIPQSIMDTFQNDNCKFNVVRPYNNSAKCNEAVELAHNLTSDLNTYDLLRRADSNPALSAAKRATRFLQSEEKTASKGVTLKQYAPWLKNPAAEVTLLTSSDFPNYLNRKDVREALHIYPELGKWEACRDLNYTLLIEGTIWIYNILKQYPDYKMMHYSGDTDGSVPTLGTKRWIQAQGWTQTRQWRPWLTDGQVSGYTKEYGSFTFTTIHGVGHMAPQWKRKDVCEMVMRYAHGEEIDA